MSDVTVYGFCENKCRREVPLKSEVDSKFSAVNTSLEEINTDIDEINTSLESKAASDHNHDDRYYTETEMDTKLSGKSDTAHTHDDRYYTETEVDTKLGEKADATHMHGSMSTITFATEEPTNVAVGEIVMVYEE